MAADVVVIGSFSKQLLLFAEETEALLLVLLPLAGAGLCEWVDGGGQGVCAARGGSAVAAGDHLGAVRGRSTRDRLDPGIHLLLGSKEGVKHES